MNFIIEIFNLKFNDKLTLRKCVRLRVRERRRGKVTQNDLDFFSSLTFQILIARASVCNIWESLEWKILNAPRQIQMKMFCLHSVELRPNVNYKSIWRLWLFSSYLCIYHRSFAASFLSSPSFIWDESELNQQNQYSKIIEHRCEMVIGFSRNTELTKFSYPSKRDETRPDDMNWKEWVA